MGFDFFQDYRRWGIFYIGHPQVSCRNSVGSTDGIIKFSSLQITIHIHLNQHSLFLLSKKFFIRQKLNPIQIFNHIYKNLKLFFLIIYQINHIVDTVFHIHLHFSVVQVYVGESCNPALPVFFYLHCCPVLLL